MKKILYLFIFILFTSISITGSPASAQTSCDNIKVDGLPEAAVIDIKKKCVELSSKTPAVNIESMSEYAELGKKYGIALSEVAKSVGTTVNELAQTPVGKFMLVMVAYNIMGTDLIGFGFGIVWFTVMIPIWLYMFNRFVLKNTKIRRFEHADGSVEIITDPIDLNSEVGGMAFAMTIILAMVCIAGFIMIF